jgi:hypothetical protein
MGDEWSPAQKTYGDVSESLADLSEGAGPERTLP